MESMEELRKRYIQGIREEEEKQLSQNAELIEDFKKKCKKKGIELKDENFRYIQTIGIVASSPNLLTYLNQEVKKDKEELVSCQLLDKYYKKNKFASGFLYSDDYMVMAHPYFRRGFHEEANFSPRFIELFWYFNDPQVIPYISIDFNRVRINVDNSICLEEDTWYGAAFKKKIKEIPDGILKLRPPLDIDDIIISYFFSYAYSLDIKWYTKNKIKTFQAEEFKTESVKIRIGDSDFYPVRYIHAEYDLDSSNFRHFDGAVHLYSEHEYNQRKRSDFNYNQKNVSHIKTRSLKLFKMNGKIGVDTWIGFISHFFSGNPLVMEYFEGKYPEYIIEILEKLRKRKM